MSSFTERLRRAWEKNDSLLCVGLDPEPERFPEALGAKAAAVFEFNKSVIDATADLVCAYKPQFAHYAALRCEEQLERTVDYVHRTYPLVPVILDVKRGDVGHTAERYASEAFDRYQADAVTVSPYLGSDSLEPFLARADKGVFILCRTSNPGARDLQDLEIGSRRLYHVVAELAAQRWNGRGNCALVVGATYPQELAEVRRIVGDMPLLLPGVGAQGADVARAVSAGQTTAGTGLLVSSSRAILYGGGTGRATPDFARAARAAAAALREEINRSRVGPARP